MERKKKKKTQLTRRRVGLNPLLQFLHIAARGPVSFFFFLFLPPDESRVPRAASRVHPVAEDVQEKMRS